MVSTAGKLGRAIWETQIFSDLTCAPLRNHFGGGGAWVFNCTTSFITSNMPLQEHSAVVLCRPLPVLGLEVGAVGVVVHIYPQAQAYEVEFMTDEGLTLGVHTLLSEDLSQAVET